MATASKKNKLPRVEPVPLDRLGTGKQRLQQKHMQGPARGRKHRGGRKPPPVPAGKSAAEIAEMDPDDPAFKHPTGKRISKEERRKRGFQAVVAQDKQNRANGRRAKVRKYEAEVMAAKREASMNGKPIRSASVEGAEIELIQQGDLTLDDWDDEELVRGYRRNRNGRFGPPPKWIPREVVQEIHRRALQRGGKKMLKAYLRSIDGLIELAVGTRNEANGRMIKPPAESEKVRLEAMKELQNRVSGKVPDRVAVSVDDPWQDMLADAYVPIDAELPLDVQGTKRAASDAPSPPKGAGSRSPASGRAARGGPQPPASGDKVKLFGDDFDG